MSESEQQVDFRVYHLGHLLLFQEVLLFYLLEPHDLHSLSRVVIT